MNVAVRIAGAASDTGGNLFVCVYADRDAERRVISIRKANKREVERYGDSIE